MASYIYNLEMEHLCFVMLPYLIYIGSSKNLILISFFVLLTAEIFGSKLALIFPFKFLCDSDYFFQCFLSFKLKITMESDSAKTMAYCDTLDKIFSFHTFRFSYSSRLCILSTAVVHHNIDQWGSKCAFLDIVLVLFFFQQFYRSNLTSFKMIRHSNFWFSEAAILYNNEMGDQDVETKYVRRLVFISESAFKGFNT